MDYKRVITDRRLQMERQRITQHLTGTCDFVNELKRRTFKSAEAVLDSVSNENFSANYLMEHGFNNPILFQKPEGLDLKIPKFKGWTNLEQYIGGDKMVEVIDVEKQDYCLVSFAAMMRYMRRSTRTKILNLISLECSDTSTECQFKLIRKSLYINDIHISKASKEVLPGIFFLLQVPCYSLGKMIQPPAVAIELDWVSKYWTTKKVGSDTSNCKDMPRVQKYCLVSPSNAYTDFHIDFGGTSVWYHVVKGAKIFYLIRPTFDNMNLYRNWLDSFNRLRTFFGDQVDDCYKLTLLPGHTLFLPTGWIHAVLTTEDSLVFGGNFLHSLNMEGQLTVYAMETKTQTPERLLYPHFEEIHWRAAHGLTKELEDMNSKSVVVPSYLLSGLKSLLTFLKQWTSSTRNSVSDKEKKIGIIKCLSKHIKNAEKLLITLNPPKPERGSTRPRKKRILEDFVDYPTSSSRKKKLGGKLKQSFDYVSENLQSEKWHVQNGGTKVVFRKLKGFSRKHDSPNDLEDKDVPVPGFENNEVSSFQNIEPSSLAVTKVSNEESWGSHWPSSSDFVQNCQSVVNFSSYLSGVTETENVQSFHTMHYGSSHINIQFPSYPGAECNISAEAHISEKEEKVLTASESLKSVVVHQDDEYIYPSLLLSDDEVQGYKMPSKDKDVPWNPKAKVGNVVPRTDRPSRVGKQKIAVEKGLEEAASVIDSVIPLKGPSKKNDDQNGGFKSLVKPASAPRISRSTLKGRRHTTVKQRLSKILKLHRRQR